MKNINFLIIPILLSSCVTPRSAEQIHNEDHQSISAVTKTYKNHAELMKSEKDNCVQNKDGWHWENVKLNADAFVLEQINHKNKKTKRSYANLLCLTKVREEQNILRLVREIKPLAIVESEEGKTVNKGILTFKVYAYDQNGKALSLLPAKRIITQEAATDYIQFKEQPVQDTILVIEATEMPPTQVLKSGVATQDSALPIYGAGTMLISNTFQYKIFPLFSGSVRGEWISRDSDFFKKAEVIKE